MRDNSILLKLAKTVFRFLASLKLAVTLIVLLAAVLAAATFVESDKGRDYARWYFYTQTWFVALLGMLGVNILSATLIRFPWKLRQFGFVVDARRAAGPAGRLDHDVQLMGSTPRSPWRRERRATMSRSAI